MGLAEKIGLAGLVEDRVRIHGAANSGGANAGAKVLSVLAGMIAGADSIEDLDRLRLGAMGAVFTGIRAPSTCGTFLRSFTHGHTKQLHAVLKQSLAVLAAGSDLLPGGDEIASLAAVTLLYSLAGLRIRATRVNLPHPGDPVALQVPEQRRLERAALRRGPRDSALIFVFLYAGPRVEETTRLELDDVAITARTGTVRLLGKGEQPRTVPLPAPAREQLTRWLDVRGREPGPLWTGQRGRLSISGLTQVVLAAGDDAGLPGLRPHRLRHTYATRLRQGGADPAQVQALLGHASLDTTARYFRPGTAETAAVVEQVFGEDPRSTRCHGRSSMSAPSSLPAGVRVRVVGDLFHGRLPPPRPGISMTYVGRGAPALPASRYANRHRVGLCRVCHHQHDQVDAVAAYAADLTGQPDLVAAARRELNGDLACWCRSSPCHGDVLLAVVAGVNPHQLANRSGVLALTRAEPANPDQHAAGAVRCRS